jgi:hypothetical protein
MKNKSKFAQKSEHLIDLMENTMDIVYTNGKGRMLAPWKKSTFIEKLNGITGSMAN